MIFTIRQRSLSIVKTCKNQELKKKCCKNVEKLCFTIDKISFAIDKISQNWGLTKLKKSIFLKNLQKMDFEKIGKKKK